ncbi:MAG: cellulase family glycosylhydrolase [Oscillospiraceae bacterium]|nr:cellulase family glycosylhydrolase [Oscillospiraceae bacterium]
MLSKRICALFSAAVLLFSALPAGSCAAAESPVGTMRDISTMDLVHDMGIGINLGNTMEACGDWVNGKCVADYEKSWGSPLVSKEMIEGIAKEGFGVLRIPVAWSNLMVKDGTYTINAELDERIHQIVDWTIGSGMYAIINIHWDMGWVNEFPDNKDESMKRFKRMWTQIAESFQNYSDYLMFECQNEELGWEKIWNPWGGTEGKAESYALCNEINQAFVDVVRGTGGNNPKRHLLISGYNTGIDRTCDPYFKMPNDPANRMAISVHYYSPAGFAILEEDADWGKATPTWGSDQDYASLRSEMDMMKTHFTDKGIPVIIGEYGCPTKNKEPESVRRFITSVCEEAYKRGHCPVLWSTPGGHYDREKFQLVDRELQKNLFAIAGKEFKPAETQPTTTTTTETETPTTTTVTTEPEKPLMGDLNGDNAVTIADAVMLTKYLMTSEASVPQAADLDGNGHINAADLSLLKREILK